MAVAHATAMLAITVLTAPTIAMAPSASIEMPQQYTQRREVYPEFLGLEEAESRRAGDTGCPMEANSNGEQLQ